MGFEEEYKSHGDDVRISFPVSLKKEHYLVKAVFVRDDRKLPAKHLKSGMCP